MVTVTSVICADVITQLDMKGCECVSVSPNCPNILYSVSTRLDIETNFSSDANNQVILESLSKPDGTVHVVFATTALGMGAIILLLYEQPSIMEHPGH